MDEQAFGHPLSTYLIVIAISLVAGLVRHLNSNTQWNWSHLLRDCITSAFNGVVVFWLCDYKKITGPLQLVIVAVAAMMGARAWIEAENYLRMRYGSGNQQQGNQQLQDDTQHDAPAQEEPK